MRKLDDGIGRLCRKHGTDSDTSSGRDAAMNLEKGQQAILEIARRLAGSPNISKKQKQYLSEKLEFEDLYRKGIVESLSDYYLTRDEVMRKYRATEKATVEETSDQLCVTTSV